MNHEAATWWAMMLSRDVVTCDALLRGEAVSPERIDRQWLEVAAHFELVRLDVHALDLLGRRPQLRSLLREAA